jgi:tryptophan-rich sensory protein
MAKQMQPAVWALAAALTGVGLSLAWHQMSQQRPHWIATD